MPVRTCSGSGGTLITLARTLVPSQSTTPATNGTGMPGAAYATMVKVRSSPSVGMSTVRNSVCPHDAQALRRSKKRAPHTVHSCATRWGRSPNTRYSTKGTCWPMIALLNGHHGRTLDGPDTLRQPHVVATIDPGGGKVNQPTIDLLDGDFYANGPYATYAWMREHAPLYWDGINEFWGVSRYDDVVEIEKRKDVFINSDQKKGGYRPNIPADPAIIGLDDPVHHVRRNLVSRRFTPKAAAAWEPEIRAKVTAMLTPSQPTAARRRSSATSPRPCRR